MIGLDGILRQAQEMQSKMETLQAELGARTVTASSGGGMVTVTATGRQEILSLVIEKTIVDPNDVPMLQDLVLTAVNEALRQSREMTAREMGSLAGGLNIPGLTS
jgi:DNA-binding YbaB/EbfC family protein